MRNFNLISAAIACIMAVASCGSANKANKMSGIGGEWNIKEVLGTEVAGKAENPAVISFDIEGGRVSGTAGCNRFMGSFKLNENGKNSISFSPLAATKMMCPDMELEDKLFKAIDAAKKVRNLKNDELGFYDEAGELVLKISR